MIIDCISDLHGHYPKLEGGDLLIIAGDLTARDTIDEYLQFYEWLDDQDYKKTIIVAGNHDNELAKEKYKGHSRRFYPATYLCDSGTEFICWPSIKDEIDKSTLSAAKRVAEAKTFKIWGSPWTKTFRGMNPHCKAFTVDTENELAEKFAKIPDDTDILITHSPPYGILDKCDNGHVGSTSLLHRIHEIKPRVVFYGHIHESYGKEIYKDSTICVNASHVDENYKPVNRPIRIEL